MTMTATPTSTPTPDADQVDCGTTLHAKFIQLRDALRGEVLEADDRIDGALIALVAGEHMAMIGPPGTAKTFLVDRLVMRIADVGFFSELMRKTMPPETVYGQVSIKGMKEDEWRYVTKGFLPEADLALLDEFVRTSDAINNGLLTILNERRFRNGADMMACPLSTAFLCANSLPIGESEHDLEAFWDRVVMRFIVELPKDRATWKAIARMRHDPNPAVVMSWADVLEAKAQARALPVTEAAFDAIDDIRLKLAEVGITMSPRRCRQAQFVAAAWAWLQGAPEVLPEHCEQLAHMLWDEPEQRAEVERRVSVVVAPGYHEALDLSDGVQELIARMEAALVRTTSDRISVLNEIHDKSVDHKDDITRFLETATGRAARTASAALRQLTTAQFRMMDVGYGVNLAELMELDKRG